MTETTELTNINKNEQNDNPGSYTKHINKSEVEDEAKSEVEDEAKSEVEDEDKSFKRISHLQVKARLEIEKYEAAQKKYIKTFRLMYTLILIFILILVWSSLFLPPITGLLTRPQVSNQTREFVEILNSSLARNQKYLPANCVANQSLTSSRQNISCPYPFIFNCTTCVPICGLWHPNGNAYFIVYRANTIITGLADFVITIIGIIILIKVPGTFKFPQICYFLMFINGVIFAIPFATAALLGPYYFFCGARNEPYEVVSEDPPIYLPIFATILHYTYISFNFWFVAASFNIFLIVFFPSLQILTSKKMKITIFIIEAIICWGVPILLPMIVLGGSKYSFIRLPQVPLPLNNTITFVTVLLPLIILTSLSITLISLSIYRLQLRKQLLVQIKGNKTKLESHEIRLILLSLLLWLVVFIIMVEISFDLRNRGNFQYFVEDYWACLTLMENTFLFPTNKTAEFCSSTYQSFTYPLFTLVADFCLGIWAVLLVTILTTRETREAWKKILFSGPVVTRKTVRALSKQTKSSLSNSLVSQSVNNTLMQGSNIKRANTSL